MFGNKRGVSGVVVTILFILLALAAVLIVWGLVRSQVTSAGSQIEVASSCLKLSLEATKCESNGAGYDVLVKRGAGAPTNEPSGMKIVFEAADGTTEVIDSSIVPGELETANNPLTPSIIPAYVSVSGVFTTGEGKEGICEPSVKVECV
jgi:hypothetical protein